jgi:hypothetical protein
MNAPDRTDEQTLDCGCRYWTEDGEAFVYQPCRPTCEHYAFVVTETRRQRKPIELRGCDTPP